MRQDGFKITVELSSVNRKQSEISINLPREMEMLEAQIRDVINRYDCARPADVRVCPACRRKQTSARDASERASGQGLRARIESRLPKQLNLSGPVTLDHLAARAGRFSNRRTNWPKRRIFGRRWRKRLSKRLACVVKMRAARRRAICARILRQRISIMRKAAAQIQKHAPEVAGALSRATDRAHQKRGA